jgi:hypothetical protein
MVHPDRSLPRWLPLAFAFATALAGVHCFNDQLTPTAPTWDVAVTVPWSDRTFTLESLIQRNASLLSATAGNQIVYSTTLGGPTSTVDNQVTLSSFNSNGTVELGNFGITLDPITLQVALPGYSGGYTGVIPPASFSLPAVTGAIEPGVGINLVSGVARIAIHNQSPLPLTLNGPVDVVNGTGTQFSFSLSGLIQPGDSLVAETDLAGKRLSSDENIASLSLSTSGSGAQTVTLPPFPLAISFSTRSLVSYDATVPRLAPQTLVSNIRSALRMGDSTKIQRIVAYGGRLDFSFTSHLAPTVLLRFRSTEIHRSNGSVFLDSILLGGGSSHTFSLDLKGVRLDAAPGALLDSLHLSTDVVIPSNINQSTSLNSRDWVSVTMSSGLPLIADSAAVVLAPTRISLRQTVPFTMGSLTSRFSGSLNIPAASLGLNVLSNVGFPIDLSLRIVGRTAGGDSAVLVLPASEKRIFPGRDTVHFNEAETGQFLSRFGTRIPDSVTVTGTALINPPDLYNPTPAGVGVITRSSFVSGSIGLTIPLRLALSTGSYKDTLDWGDTNGDGTSDNSFKKSDLNSVNQGTMYLEVQNGLPVQLAVQLVLVDSLGKPLLSLPLSNGPYAVPSAQVDVNGFATTPGSTNLAVVLNESQIHQFTVAHRIAYLFSLSTGGTAPVVLRTTDQVHLRAWSTLSYRVKQ